jgi:uncharacterized protein (TIGR02271 family)
MTDRTPDGRKVVHPGEATDEPSVRADAIADGNETIPIVEERVRVDKRVVDKGGLRVSTEIDEVTEALDVALRQQTAKLDRVKVDRVVDTAPEPRLDGDTVIVPIVEERAVVTKQLVVVEEVRIRLDEIEKHEEHSVPLRKERVRIDRIPSEGEAQAAPVAADGDDPARPDART